jgi:glutaminyl-peptide cyclotransferase
MIAPVQPRDGIVPAILIALFVFCTGACTGTSSGARAMENLRVRVLAEYPHDRSAFTQGLEWHDGRLYESTGLAGRSTVRRVELETGGVEQRVELPVEIFAEGLTRVEHRLIQLSWHNGRAIVWDLSSLQPVSEFRYTGQGWGLCHDGRRLIMSDGSDKLSFRDASTFEKIGEVSVTRQGESLARLNELECVDGEVYANIWPTESIARIDPASGRVTGWIDASGLLAPSERPGADVLNGIAHLHRDRFLLTGKNWPKLFEVVFEKVQP